MDLDFDTISIKHNNELEQQTTQILKVMRKAKLQHHPIYASLQAFEQQLSEARRNRFDENNSQYPGY